LNALTTLQEVYMARLSDIEEHMEVIGADGVHIGTIDRVEGDRLKLTKADSGQGSHEGHHHYISRGLVAEVEGGKVRLSATGANAFMFREEQDHASASLVRGSTSSARYLTKSHSKGGSKPNPTVLALGAAALVAALGAGFMARRKPARVKHELQLQDDENLRLISSSKVEGTPVIGRNGEHLGKIENFMVDKYSGRVAYAVLSFGGTFGFGDSLFPLPWSYLNYDEKKDGYALDITKEQLADFPRFKATDAPEFSLDYRRSLASAHDRSGHLSRSGRGRI
jgi:hypothetical protein